MKADSAMRPDVVTMPLYTTADEKEAPTSMRRMGPPAWRQPLRLRLVWTVGSAAVGESVTAAALAHKRRAAAMQAARKIWAADFMEGKGGAVGAGGNTRDHNAQELKKPRG